MPIPLTASATDRLRGGLRGTLVLSSDAAYSTARRVWNGRIDRRPAAIARCADAADVVACVRFARAHDLPLAVRGGGHAVAGLAVCDGGLVVDLSGLKSVRVDAHARVARAEPGATLADLDRATQAFGLATPAGTDSEVGIAGLTLGGGNGWLMGAYGATVDNLLSADVVTADGRRVTASAQVNEDLFWALRGGGGNFGIVTSFEYRLHTVGPQVMAGAILYPFANARDVLHAFRAFTHDAPDALTVFACLIRDADGVPVVCMAACHAGPLEVAVREVRPLRSLGPVLQDNLQPRPFVEWQSFLDAARPAGRGCAMRSHFLDRLDEGFVAALVAQFEAAPSPLSVAIVEHCHGAIARVAPQATAFAARTSPFHFEAIAFWERPAEAAANLAWCDAFFAATRPFSSGRVYVNSLDAGEGDRLAEAYGPNLPRLRAIKREWDATNLFRGNHNIAPA